MRKHDTLDMLRELAEGPPLPIEFRPIPYGYRGSTFSADTIRITGTKHYIRSWLSHHAKDLLAHENDTTRLAITFQPSHDRDTGEPLGTYDCSIRVWERGQRGRFGVQHHRRTGLSQGTVIQRDRQAYDAVKANIAATGGDLVQTWSDL